MKRLLIVLPLLLILAGCSSCSEKDLRRVESSLNIVSTAAISFKAVVNDPANSSELSPEFIARSNEYAGVVSTNCANMARALADLRETACANVPPGEECEITSSDLDQLRLYLKPMQEIFTEENMQYILKIKNDKLRRSLVGTYIGVQIALQVIDANL